MYSSCPIKYKCEKCGTEFSTKRKHSTHLSSCSSAPLIPTSASVGVALLASSPPLATSTSPSPIETQPLAQTSAGSVPRSSTVGAALEPSASGDQRVQRKQATEQPLIGLEDSVSVLLDDSFQLPSFELPIIDTFDLDKYLIGEADFDLFSG